MTKINKMKQYFNTIKHLKTSQLFYRFIFIIKRKVLFKLKITHKIFLKSAEELNLKKIELNVNLVEPIKIKLDKEELNSLSDDFNLYKQKRFTFLNKTIDFEDEIEWTSPQVSQLWLYNLHYFDYSRQIGSYYLMYNDLDAYDVHKEFVNSWIKYNSKVGIGDGWHPYTVSLRLVNWIFCYSIFFEEIEKDIDFKEKYIKSIFLQSNYLLSNLEYDVCGNHLFENAKALCFVGMLFHNTKIGSEFLEKGERLMKNELNEQILEDGGHFERSPMYHSIVLKGLSELIYTYKNVGIKIPSAFLDFQNEMIYYLKNIIHPDGEIPLFNDSAFEIANSPDYLFKYILGEDNNKVTLTPFDKILKGNKNIINNTIHQKIYTDFYNAEESGYLISKDKSVYFALDYGKPCPEYLPAHAHADIFSYELSLNNERIITDSGTYEYAQGKYRNFNRSTKAHNTVTFKRKDQSEMWGNFRVAERANVKMNKLKNDETILNFIGEHDGFFDKYKIIHKRQVFHIKDKLIVVLDKIEGEEETKAKDIESYIHISPHATFLSEEQKIITDENSLRVIALPDTSLISVEEGILREDYMQGWYSPEFGKMYPRETLIYSPIEEISKTFNFGYALILDNEIEFKSKTTKAGLEITLNFNNKTESYYLNEI